MCDTGKVLNPDSTCQGTCPSTHYNNQGICSPCDGTCASCTDSTSHNCSSCSGALFYDQGSCVSSCSNGFFEGSNNICDQCDANCATCETSSTNCITCPSGQALLKSSNGATSSCIDPCPANYFKTADGISCQSKQTYIRWLILN